MTKERKEWIKERLVVIVIAALVLATVVMESAGHRDFLALDGGRMVMAHGPTLPPPPCDENECPDQYECSWWNPWCPGGGGGGRGGSEAPQLEYP